MGVRNNDVDFVKTVFLRLLPRAAVSVTYAANNLSLQPSITVHNFDEDGKAYRAVQLDLALFLARYEKNGIEKGDEQTMAELLTNGAMGPKAPVSTGQGIPAADPFAPPEGLPTQDRFQPGQKSR